jgi:PKD repeat protein
MQYLSICLFVLLSIFFGHVQAQVTPVSGVINHYAPVIAFDSCTGKLSVPDTTGFRPGMLALLIQMQGVAIVNDNVPSYGSVTNMNDGGKFERVLIDSVREEALFLHNRPVNAYNLAGKIQIITIPRFQRAVVTDTLRPQPWNGTTGGVLAMDVSDTLYVNAPISADGLGFRGGTPFFASTNNCNFLIPEFAYFYAAGNWRGAFKGEGVAPMATGKELGRGPQANGGGGGNDHNSGGGGGGNLGPGGNGGQNNEPSALGCRGFYPGFGGIGLPVSADRMFAGGGGGAGHANNDLTSGGGNGGGILFISAGKIAGTSMRITTNGLSAPTANGDGAGGGGAGGTIRLEVGSVAAGLVLLADGGNGGDTQNNGQNRCFGPGGGGCGGRILTNLNSIAAPKGGLPGLVTGSSNGCNGASNTAQAGSSGAMQPLNPKPIGTLTYENPVIINGPAPVQSCPGKPAAFQISTNSGAWTYQWQVNNGNGWQNITSTQGYTGYDSAKLTVSSPGANQNGLQYRCLVSRGSCFQTTSASAGLTVLADPTAAFNSTITGNIAAFQNLSTNASGFNWAFGDGAVSTQNNPTHTYGQDGIYHVVLTAWNACDTVTATQSVTIQLPPAAEFSVPDTTLDCYSATVHFTHNAFSSATSFTWTFPGGSPSTSLIADPDVTYTVSGNYTATLIASKNAGADTVTHHFIVQIDTLPANTFTYSVGASGLVQFTDITQPGVHFTWDFGDGSAVLAADNPSHQYMQSGTYTVTLIAANICGASVSQHSVVVQIVAVHTPEQAGLQLFPNPADRQFILECPCAGQRWEVENMQGQILMAGRMEGEKQIIPTADLPAGMYCLKMISPEGWYRVARFVIQR